MGGEIGRELAWLAIWIGAFLMLVVLGWKLLAWFWARRPGLEGTARAVGAAVTDVQRGYRAGRAREEPGPR
jgi:hypothetical protein